MASALRQRSPNCTDCTSIPWGLLRAPGEETNFSLLPIHPHFYSGSQVNSFFSSDPNHLRHHYGLGGGHVMRRKAGKPSNALDAYVCKWGMRNPFKQGTFCSTDPECSTCNVSCHQDIPKSCTNVRQIWMGTGGGQGQISLHTVETQALHPAHQQ